MQASSLPDQHIVASVVSRKKDLPGPPVDKDTTATIPAEMPSKYEYIMLLRWLVLLKLKSIIK